MEWLYLADSKWQQTIPAINQLALIAWLGGLWSIGYLAVPTLFYAQTDRMLAGMLAGLMFQKIGWLGFACGGWLLWQWAKQRHLGFWLVAIMLLLSAAIHFGFQPMMAALKTHDISQAPYKQQFAWLHGLSSLCYLIESLLGVWLAIFFAKHQHASNLPSDKR